MARIKLDDYSKRILLGYHTPINEMIELLEDHNYDLQHPEWISPSSHTDPLSFWSNETNAYDGITYTSSKSQTHKSYGQYLYLAPSSAILCNKVRFMIETHPDYGRCMVDVYYSSAWHNIYDVLHPPSGSWIEASIGNTETVSETRIRFYISGDTALWCAIYEFEFWGILT